MPRQTEGWKDRQKTDKDRQTLFHRTYFIEKKLKFKTFWNISNITEYFEKLTSFTSIIIDTSHLLKNEAQVPYDELQFQN